MAPRLVLLRKEDGDRVAQERAQEDTQVLTAFFEPLTAPHGTEMCLYPSDVDYLITHLVGKGPWSEEALRLIKEEVLPLSALNEPKDTGSKKRYSIRSLFVDERLTEMENPEWLQSSIDEFLADLHYQFPSKHRAFILAVFVAFLTTA